MRYDMKIAILGGTGKEGKGLARRLARAGLQVIIGSRDGERAGLAARELSQAAGVAVEGCENLEAARRADAAVLCVPFSAHLDTLEQVGGALQGKLLIDVAVPLAPGDPTRYNPPPEGSALAQAQRLLAGVCPVVGAFQSIAARSMNAEGPLDSDVFVLGDDPQAKERAMELVVLAGGRPVDAGGVACAPTIEALTPLLIGLNKRYKRPGIGLRLTGLCLEGD